MPEQNKLLQQFTPGSREWYANQLYGTVVPSDLGQRNADSAEFIASMAPVTGEAISARDAWDASGRAGNALLEGNYGQAASDYGNMLLGIAGAVPGVGIVARGTKRGAQWMDRNLPEGFNRLLDSMTPSDPKNTSFIFAGPTAKTADQGALKQAQELAASGASRDDIWKQTGWFQGVDGKWRFEIDDSHARYKPDFTGRTLPDAIEHPAAIDAYPMFSNMHAAQRYGYDFKGDIGVKGAYSPEGGITVHDDLGSRSGKSVMLHELQHAVQSREGFTPGSNPQTANLSFLSDLEERTRPMLHEIQRRREAGLDYSDLKARYDAIWEQAQKIDKSPSLQHQLYLRNAGETEARNVQTRMNYTPEQRRATPPWETQDVPDDQQIVRFR